jgi:RNA polymerase sigma factor for flagellar operon FliA
MIKHTHSNSHAISSASDSPSTLRVADVREGFAEQRERLVMDHLPIVRFIARRIYERLPRHVLIEDLYSSGVVGLLDAVDKFDSSKKILFRTYAQFRIRGAIFDSLRTLDWGPRDLRRKGREIEEANQMLRARFGRDPNELEISQVLNMDLAAYQLLVGELRGLGMSALISERFRDSGEEQLVSVPGPAKEDPLFRCMHAEMRDRLAAAILKLRARERLVMILYYYEESTMREIGLILGVLEARVSQIHTSAVLHLREELSQLTHGQSGNRDVGPGRRLRSLSYLKTIAVSKVND